MIQDSEVVYSIAQVTRSGRAVMKPKRNPNTSALGSLSLQIGTPISYKVDSLHSMSIIKAQLDHDNIIN